MEYINLILNIILWLCIIQASTLTHELGHAIWGIIYTKEKVIIELGRKKDKIKELSLGRLEFHLGGFDPFSGFTFVNTKDMRKHEKLLFYIGGPLISLIIGMSLFFIRNLAPYESLSKLILLISYFHLYQFLVTIIPMVYPTWWGAYGGYSSDGYKSLMLLIGKK